MKNKIRASRNRTVTLGKSDIQKFESNLLFLRKQVLPQEVLNKTINQSLFDAIDLLPENFVDLLFIDPPYNLNKEFNTNSFKKKSDEEYENWVEDWLVRLKKILTSVGRLAKFYSDDKNCFVILEVTYSIKGICLTVEHVNFVPIEFLSWSCLTIGALGLGQIQIKNSNVITIDVGKTRKEWMLDLCEKLAVFYPKEVTKIGKRITYFQGIKKYWEDKI